MIWPAHGAARSPDEKINSANMGKPREWLEEYSLYQCWRPKGGLPSSGCDKRDPQTANQTPDQARKKMITNEKPYSSEYVLQRPSPSGVKHGSNLVIMNVLQLLSMGSWPGDLRDDMPH